MQGQITEPAKRYVPIAVYQRMTGMSYPTIKNALETGQLKGVKTEAGHWKIDTQDGGNTDTAAIVRRLDEQERMLKALCGFFKLEVC